MSISILVPTDFSKNAHSALLYALKMAQSINANITVLHVYEKPAVVGAGLYSTLDEYVGLIKKEAEAEFEKYKAKLSQLDEAKDLTLTYKLIGGHVSKIVLKYTHRHNIDLVIMGTQGRTASEAIFLGNVSAETMESLDVPVLTIPPNFSLDSTLDSLGFATDYKEDAYQALEWLINFEEYNKFKIHSVHIGPEDQAKAAEWERHFDGILEDHMNIDEDDFVLGIKDFITKKNLDIIAITLTKKNFLYRLFNRARVKQIVYEKTIPVLAVPDKIWKN